MYTALKRPTMHVSGFASKQTCLLLTHAARAASDTIYTILRTQIPSLVASREVVQLVGVPSSRRCFDPECTPGYIAHDQDVRFCPDHEHMHDPRPRMFVESAASGLNRGIVFTASLELPPESYMCAMKMVPGQV